MQIITNQANFDDNDNDLRKATQGLTHVSVKDADAPYSVTASDDRSAAVP